MDIEVLPKDKKLKILYGNILTRYGRILTAYCENRPCAIHFIKKNDPSCGLDELKKRWPSGIFIEDQKKAIEKLGQRQKRPSLLVSGTPFQIQVWRELLRIPLGTTVTYQKIALKVKRAKAFRAVGTAIGKNPLAMLIPCHRVVNKSQKTTKYRWGKTKKLMMIQDESQGIQVFPPYIKML